jgi:DHA2 family multidrug resistance protein-like MFS transporter
MTIENRRWWALGGITLAVLAVSLDGTVLSVALPTLAAALHASESDLQWFSSGYLLVLAALTLPAGLLGDRYGRKRVLLLSLALFGAGSAACAYAPSAAWFIAARAVLGVAGAGIVVMALSSVTVLFSEEERPRAVGIWSAANFLALPLGPILGGWLLTHYWWGWVFLINVPVALVGLVVGAALVPESRAPERPALDPLGVVSSTSGLAILTYGLIQAGHDGWGAAGALAPMLAGLALLAGFFAWERRLGQRPGGQPLVDMALFRSGSFTWGVILAATAGLAMIGVLFALPQYFQAVLGLDAMGSGLRLLPVIAGLVAGAVPADRIARRIGAKLTVALGFAVLGVAASVGATTGTGSGGVFIAGWTAVFGAGMGLVFATAASAALAELSSDRSGVGAAVMQALQKVGGPFGAALLGSVLNSVYHARLQLTGLPATTVPAVRESVFGGLAVARQLRSPALLDAVRSAFVQGMDVALMVSAGIAAAGLVLALVFLPRGTPSPAPDAGSVEKEVPAAVTR